MEEVGVTREHWDEAADRGAVHADTEDRWEDQVHPRRRALGHQLQDSRAQAGVRVERL